MATDEDNIGRFTVNFGAGVSLDPPKPPSVRVSSSGSLTTLSASWQSGGSQIDQYRYAIGTTPNARDVVGWTYLAGTSFTRQDLSLIAGQTYYVTVQAHGTNGLWSATGVSIPIVAGTRVTTDIYLPTITR
jgi:hypothetical protein